MIESKVREILTTFTARWAFLAKCSPVLRLDHTWPSIAVVDAITYHLRGVSDLTSIQIETLSGAACYIGSIAHDVWRASGIQSELSFTEEGVLLRAPLGEGGEYYNIPIERVLRRILENPPTPFPVFEEFSQQLAPDQNFVSLLALGIILGRSPFNSSSTEGFRMQLDGDFDARVKELAKQSAAYYAAIFPNEPLGQVAELYLNQLIYPPETLDESLPCCNAAIGIFEFAEQFKLSRTALLKLGRNLAQVADTQISDLGIVVVGALTEELPDEQIRAVCHAKGKYLGLLRTAMLALRLRLGLPADWILSEKFGEEEKKRLTIERAMGFLPWVKLETKTIGKWDPKVLEIIANLAGFDFQRSVSGLEELIDEDPRRIDARLQRLYLDIVNADFEKVSVECRKLVSEPAAESNPILFHYWGLSLLARGEFAEGAKQLERAYQLSQAGEAELFGELATSYAWSLINVGDLVTADQVLSEALTNSPVSIVPMLNRANILIQSSREAELVELIRKLATLAPLNRQVFELLRLSYQA